MLSVREKYWRYSLFVLIAGLGLTIFAELTPFLGGLLGAVTIYVLLRRQMWFLSERRRWRRSLAASLLLGEAIFFFLVPISLIVWMVVDKIQGVALDPQSVITPVRHVAGLIQQKTGYDLWSESNLQSVLGYLPRAGQWLVGGIVNFAVNLVVLLFVLYFMLIGGLRMETYCREILPFDRCAARSVMREIHMIVRSNAIVIPLLAVSQGVVAYVGYLAFGVPEPLFWGVLTCFATILPIVGTALVWLPLAAYMSLDGNWGQGVGLVMYGTLVVTQVDNLVRMVMQKKMADVHPLITIFGVFIGLSLFGFMGVIFGPLMLAMFIFCVNIFKRTYLADVAGNTNTEVFCTNADTLEQTFDESRAKLTNARYAEMMATVAQRLTEYTGGSNILTDDKAPVELLGMRVLDELIAGELSYYKSNFAMDDIMGMLGA